MSQAPQAVLVVMAVVSTRWLPGVCLPGYFKVLIVTVWGLGALQLLGTLVSLLVTGSARQRRTVGSPGSRTGLALRG
jgi:hypothetical protein